MTYDELKQAIFEELETDAISVFDIEVFKYNWLVVIQELNTDDVYKFWDTDYDAFRIWLDNNQNIMCGFNIKHYDNPMINAICNGHDVQILKMISDNIVKDGMMPWDIPECRGQRWYDSIDLMDDTQLGTSLKGFEAHMGMNIVESSVDFDIDRPLTVAEKAETEYYCCYDVKATIRMLYERRGYLGTKVRLGKKKNLSIAESLYMTNAKLTAKYLGAVKQEHNDQFDYVFPDNIKYEYIDQGVIDFFKTIKAGDLLLDDKAKSFTGMIGNCEYKVGAGGIHGCNGVYNMTADEDHLILNDDVMQFYPSMIVENHYLSRNVPDPEDYKRITIERANAKRSGDKKTANCLKLVNNTTYGAQKNQYNDLYDPLMALSICLSGQLYLLELATHLYKDTGCELIQLNTDGIMLRIEKSKYEQAEAIMKEWQERTHFLLEEDNIELIIQRDVNNYLERQVGGATKVKGGALVRGISYVGAFKINNNATIIPKAIEAWFFEGIPPEKTINECNDLMEFQIIAKSGSKYRYTYQMRLLVDHYEYVPIQKCNRVYATNDQTLGTLFKQKDDYSGKQRIASLPYNCIIDNDNKLGIDEVNKSWYIEEAKKNIKAFTQEDKGDLLTMATKKTTTPKVEPVTLVDPLVMDYSQMNVRRKLLHARCLFAEQNPQPSGYNDHADFDYFELKDIVPLANKVFLSVGLMLWVTFHDGNCVGTLENLDGSVRDNMIFTIPVTHIAEPGKFRMNEIQALGSEITYLRRYMYLIVLDIVQNDEIDCGKSVEAPAVKPAVKATPKTVAAPKAPVNSNVPPTPAERTEIKKELTNSEDKADELRIKKLKELVSEWIEKIPANKEIATELIVKTNGFTDCTKKDADMYIDKINALIAGTVIG